MEFLTERFPQKTKEYHETCMMPTILRLLLICGFSITMMEANAYLINGGRHNKKTATTEFEKEMGMFIYVF